MVPCAHLLKSLKNLRALLLFLLLLLLMTSAAHHLAQISTAMQLHPSGAVPTQCCHTGMDSWYTLSEKKHAHYDSTRDATNPRDKQYRRSALLS